jgi:hypothetical protein
MPVLDLTPEMIGPDNADLTLGYIEGVMVWPEDEENRRLFVQARRAKEYVELVEAFAKVDPQAKIMNVADMAVTFAALATSPRPTEVGADRQRRYSHGSIAGWILWDGLVNCHSGTGHGLEAVKRDISKRLKTSKGHPRFSVSTINNTIWPRFRPVAYMWLAHMFHASLGRSDGEPVPRPCKADDLLKFLEMAEQFRRDGEGCRPRHSDQPILDPTRTWKGPPGLRLREQRFVYDRSKLD